MAAAAALLRPLSPSRAAFAVAGVSAAVALYCLGYSIFRGQPETLAMASAWALVNVAPWLVAIEYLKRTDGWKSLFAILAGTVALSIMLGAILIGGELSTFELWRRVPMIAGVAAITLLLRRTRERQEAVAPTRPIPFPVTSIAWVKAAGNYVELSLGDRIVLHRTTLSAVQRELESHGFVRIHRSILVRRDRIERVRNEDVVLRDGTHLKIGKRYRSSLSH